VTIVAAQNNLKSSLQTHKMLKAWLAHKADNITTIHEPTI
jgi:hypothetical protein